MGVCEWWCSELIIMKANGYTFSYCMDSSMGVCE